MTEEKTTDSNSPQDVQAQIEAVELELNKWYELHSNDLETILYLEKTLEELLDKLSLSQKNE